MIILGSLLKNNYISISILSLADNVLINVIERCWKHGFML